MTSILASTIPLITLALEVFVLRQQRLRWQTAIALLVGFVGVAVMTSGLVYSGIRLLPCLAILGASMAWSLGAVLMCSRKLPDSRPLAAGAQMMFGGALLLAASLLSGELHHLPEINMRATLALVYLITAGSVVSFSAFTYLLGRMPASRVATHAYVNPVVAVMLGHFVDAESITSHTIIGGVLVIGSVVATTTINRNEVGMSYDAEA